MATDNQPPQLISLESRALLEAQEFFAVQRPGEPHLFNVFGFDGDYAFSCTASINPENLAFLIDYGKRTYRRGCEDGAEGLRAALRDLLQVDRGAQAAT